MVKKSVKITFKYLPDSWYYLMVDLELCTNILQKSIHQRYKELTEEERELETLRQDKEADIKLHELYESSQKDGINIPKFFSPKRKNNEPSINQPNEIEQNPSHLSYILRQNTVKCFLSRKSEDIFSDDELQSLWNTISENALTLSTGDERLNYASFCSVRNCLSEKAATQFSTSDFLKFSQDKFGCISGRSFFHCIVKRTNALRMRVALATYDENGTGYLNTEQLEEFIWEQIQGVSMFDKLRARSLHKLYVVIAAKKFFFFLDLLKRGRIRISDILSSNILNEFNELRFCPPEKEQLFDLNWFSPASTLSVWDMFIELAVNGSDSITTEQLQAFGEGSLTPSFINSVADVHLKNRLMPFPAFLDFLLAVENKDSVAGLKYYWACFDPQRKGFLDRRTILSLLKKVEEQRIKRASAWEAYNKSASAEDLCNEIFDMVRSPDHDKITLESLSKSKTASVVLALLTDANGLGAYEGRQLQKIDKSNKE